MVDYHCRDCARCTESALTALLMRPLRFMFGIFIWIANMTKPRCPQCGHPLEWHFRDEDGRFVD